MTVDNVNASGDERLALSFSQHVVRLQGLLEQAIAPTLAAQSLTSAELDVLGALRSAGSPYQLRPKELTTRLLLTTGGLSNVLRRLDARGLVHRVPDPSDGRSHNVRLTPVGVAAARAATSSATTALQRFLSVVPTATLEDALRQLHSILGAVDDAPYVPLVSRNVPEGGASAPRTAG
ncbi:MULTISPECIES: MarR family winged helix-turn-helix transcriptional regulator [Streptomyces]|uniref:MarR family winged helix-turn-helix transcriptional regulator n=1 Tax=Streptomyces TaxID=1883 RepID=UPI00177C92BD|nr:MULTISPECIES: MarR family winged helix-turn-helix transcriptional regulator [Streptomyces]MDX3086866.1 MarR family winged helix-turn-helix transcriptional regulator [Streptomyces sp. ME12-02E]MDX3330737.1 MarR family winged helix-turn-helix transcriptional regulator [Streptomyces sp. ME02-6978a]MDX3359633.1 MarR family winged helix-turn-helix transcriptional regulator [Streptomyces sp. ME02-6978.2a]GHE36210.1 MarR family transcriptional regulator [Streptomyces griseoaurantiacus]